MINGVTTDKCSVVLSPAPPPPLPPPAVEGRLQLLNINLQGVKMEEGVKLEEIAELTEGYSGADITSVCR